MTESRPTPGEGLDPTDLRIPPSPRGLRIGLFGGSFNPPHLGHRHVAEAALARLRLDRLWVMVTPANPLKTPEGLAALGRRIAATRALMRHPRIVVTAFEAALGTSYTWRTVERLAASRPGVDFVWVMGADNLAGFHRWQQWQRIARTVPIAVVDRPGATESPLSARAARTFADRRLPECDAARLPSLPAPAWVFLHPPHVDLSSTDLRRSGRGL